MRRILMSTLVTLSTLLAVTGGVARPPDDKPAPPPM